jgi:hypothetical protein
MSYNAINKLLILILSEERKSECCDDFDQFSLRFLGFHGKVEKKSEESYGL